MLPVTMPLPDLRWGCGYLRTERNEFVSTVNRLKSAFVMQTGIVRYVHLVVAIGLLTALPRGVLLISERGRKRCCLLAVTACGWRIVGGMIQVRGDEMMQASAVAAATRLFNVVSYGAQADGETVNTKAIQAAVDACGAAGGGTVVVPAGCFVTGTIWLRSHVELHLQHGAVLKANPNLDDYNTLDAYPQNWFSTVEEWNGSHLILAIEVEDVAVTGTGTIDGNGAVFFAEPKPYDPFIWRDGLALARDKERLRPGQTIVCCESKNIRLRDFAIRDATCWCVFLHGCEDAFISGLKITNASYAANTDGIDIDCCRNVTISDCLIDTGDDAITLRGDPVRLKDATRVCENVVVKNCVVGSSSSVFRIGVGTGVIRNAVFSNIVITRGGIGLHFQSSYSPGGRGVAISNITFRDVYARNLALPFVISAGQPDATAPIENIIIDGYHAEVFAGGNLYGNAYTRPKHVRLRNIDLVVVPRPLQGMKPEKAPETLLEMVGVDDIRLENVSVEWRTNDPGWIRTLAMRHSTGLVITEDCRLTDPPPPTTGQGVDEWHQ